MKIHPSQLGMERFAQVWCAYQRTYIEDDKVCGPMAAVGNPAPGIAGLPQSSSELSVCKAALCFQRNEVCAGFMLEELGRSPLQRELDASNFDSFVSGSSVPPLKIALGQDGLQLSKAELDAFGEAARVGGTARRFRFQPLAAEGRAAAFRGSLNRFRDATRWAHEIRTYPLPDLTCLQRFQATDLLGLNGDNAGLPPLDPYPDGRRVSWTDIYVTSFLDAANEFNAVLPRTLASMRDASALVLNGVAAPQDATATQWNGKVNSATAAAKLFAYGDEEPPVVMQTLAAEPCSPETHSSQEIGPTGVPVCPPVSQNEGVQIAKSLFAVLKVIPKKPPVGKVISALLKAWKEDQEALGKPVPSSYSETDFKAQFKVTDADAEAAQLYLCQEAKAFGFHYTPIPGTGTGGKTERYFSTKPVSYLPGGVLKSHFSGALKATADIDLTSDAYSKSAAGALDQMKLTTGALKLELTSAVNPKINTAIGGMLKAMEKQLGGRRLEFLVGMSSLQNSGSVEKLKILIHGVPPAGETFWVVQGLAGLKCVTAGSIDGAPCNAADYRHEMPTTVGPLDPRMSDLDPISGTLSEEITTLPKPGDAQSPIGAFDAVYVVRLTNGAYERAFGGVIPTPLTNGFVANAPGYTRRVFMSAGGALDDVLGEVLAPHANDCSQAETTCAGLSKGLWPPLESEITADPAQFGFERSWQRYLELAKVAADEADVLGEKLLESGLDLDIRREEATRLLIDACGPDASGETGCSDGGALGTDILEWVTLGDKQACLWQVGPTLCACPVALQPGENCPKSLTSCPFVLGSDAKLTGDQTADEQTCGATISLMIQATGKTALSSLKAIPAAHWLGISKVEASGVESAPCKAFNKLRKPAGVDGAVPANLRSEVIRNEIVKRFGLDDMIAIAQNLHYEEGFGDHYRLRYANATVFDTNRPSRPSINDSAAAPCKQSNGKLKAEDLATGSGFWTSGVGCFVSGVTCPPPDGIGYDGCPVQWLGDNNQLSLDTEPVALRNRWAWGFGNLRRAVATLGLITGEIDGMMAVAEWIPASRDWNPNPGDESEFVSISERVGWDCKIPEQSMREPAWVQHCRSGTAQRCVEIGKKGGAGGDSAREKSGRPWNANGYLPNRRAAFNMWPSAGPSEVGTVFNSPADRFPCSSPGGATCTPNKGIDPQMVYCSLPSKQTLLDDLLGDLTPYDDWNQGAELPFRIPGGAAPTYSTGYVGDSVTRDAKLPMNQKWKDSVATLWGDPSGDFCAKPNAAPVVWKAFCSPPTVPTTDLAALALSDDFMRFGRLPKVGGLSDPEYVSREGVAGWFNGVQDSAAMMLFDLRSEQTLGNLTPPFQYAITQRNIYDAFELACHARARGTGAVDCDTIGLEGIEPNVDYRKQLGRAAAVIRCHANAIRQSTGRTVVGPVSRALVEAFGKNQGLSSASGRGGRFLQELTAQYDALSELRKDVDHVSDALDQVALSLEQLSLIEQKKLATIDELKAQQISVQLANIATIARDVGQATNVVEVTESFGFQAATHVAAAAATGLKMLADWKAFQKGIQVAELQGELDTVGTVKSALSELAHARDAINDIPVRINAFVVAASNLRTLQKQADFYRAQVDLSDFAGDKGNDPQFVNIASRRIYSTNLTRYEAALDRARKLSFIARRAIELRFGVDLERMSSEMILVPAPQTWANDICTMTGLDYSKFREPDPEKAVEKFSFGEPPPEDVQFASQFVGGYVRRLEDFVTGYPFDFPLKESDDTGVISLANDVFGVSAKCEEPSLNRLYYSTEFEKRDREEISADTRGWAVDGCGASVQNPLTQTTETWRGCLSVEPAKDQDAVPVGAPHPVSAVPYRIGNRPCVPVPGQAATCPPTQTYSAVGILTQRLEGLTTGFHTASLYVHADPNAAPYPTGNAPEIRVVRSSDSVVVAQVDVLPLATGWKRFELPFQVEPGQTYRLELVPSKVAVALSTGPNAGPSDWPGIVVSAAQVEAVEPSPGGTLPKARIWQRTGVSRTVVNTVCNAAAGSQFRQQFKRHCEYLCADGISTGCTGIDSTSVPSVCFYEAHFNVSIEDTESGAKIPTGQIAVGNFNYRHNEVGLNVVGTGVTNCENAKGVSCYANGFLEYTLSHNGSTQVRNWEGATLPVTMQRAHIEHGKALAAERVLTNPPSSQDSALMEPFTKGEFEGRPVPGLYTLRVWDRPELRWENIEDIQLLWKYHYWTRFQK